jgi:HPt (histidine-containing phosphotransfer) domain-containing protein
MPDYENALEELIFDQIGVMQRVDNDLDLLKELVEIFFADYYNTINQIKSAIATNDGKLLQESSHFIKSALGNLGAMAAYQTAARLEQKGKTQELSEAENLLKELVGFVEQYQKEVAEFFSHQ